MTAEQNIKTYEVGFSTDAMQHIFYISCEDGVDAKTFAHAVFHYYDIPEDWGRKICINAIALINPKSCIPDFLHIGLQSKQELAMPEENEESHKAVGKIIRQVMKDGFVPMAIYDDENKTMTVYSTIKLDVEPQKGAASVVLNFSQFGNIIKKTV